MQGNPREVNGAVVQILTRFDKQHSFLFYLRFTHLDEIGTTLGATCKAELALRSVFEACKATEDHIGQMHMHAS